MGKDYGVYSEWHERKGDKAKAREKLNKAIKIFAKCGADGWVKKYEKEMEKLS